MKIRDVFLKYGLIIAWSATLLLPLYGKLLDSSVEVSGVSAQAKNIELSASTLADGSYQTYLNDQWESNFPGKKALLKLRNQILYSFFRVSPNSNVVICKDRYLWEPEYILSEIQYTPPASTEYFDTLGKNLNELNKLLRENGKELYVFITPSKAHFYREYISDKYMFLDNEDSYDYTNYSKLLETLKDNDIPYYDSVDFITNNKDYYEAPLFYSTGIHWSHPWSNICAANFLDYMNSKSQFDMGHVSVTAFRTNEVPGKSADLYSSLNVMLKPEADWWDCEMVVDKEGTDKPSIFCRGGSFMGQSLSSLIRSDLFSDDVHFENNYYFTDKYESTTTLSSRTAYDEMDLESLIKDKDILVLEVNEGHIHKMSWGFIEYLLEHPSYIEN